MILKKTTSVQCDASNAKKDQVLSREELLSRINQIAQCQDEDISFNEDGSLNLNGLSMRCMHNILLETEKLGLNYSIEKSTVIKIKEAS